MASIDQIVEQIRTAVYGKDVRENIAQGIEQCYGETAKISDLNNAISSMAVDDNGEIYSAITWKLGHINSDTGEETIRSNSMLSAFIPIDQKDIAQFYRLDEDNKAPGWYANIHYFDANQQYLGSLRPGSSMYQTSYAVMPTKHYATTAYVRFECASVNGGIKNYKQIFRCSVKKKRTPAFEEKLRQLQSNYEVLDLEFTNAGGISNGTPYNVETNSQRFRTVTAYPFPIGSKIIVPDDIYSIYSIWVPVYYDAGLYSGQYFGQTSKPISEIVDSDFDSQDKNYFIAIAGQTLGNVAVTEDMIADLANTVKIAIPKSEIISEDRISGDIIGAKNLFSRIPFAFERASSYYYQSDKNTFTQIKEDARIWSKDNADYSVTLEAGTYHLYIESISNISENPTSFGYEIFDEDGTIISGSGARSPERYNTEYTFNLASDGPIFLQWKSYIGNTFAIYLYKDSYSTLKVVSNKVKELSSYIGDDEYTSIYSAHIQNLVKKYDATVLAGNIGYIWISDLHINSLYPDRNRALKRQLMACADIANRTNIQFIMIGGDIIDRETSHATIFSIFNEVFSGVKESRRPVALILGNHDDNPYTNNVPLTKDQARALFIDMGAVNMIALDSQKNYYYFDRLGYRFICLDAIDYPNGYKGDSWWGFSETQVKWLAEVLEQTSQRAIILSHITLDEGHTSWGLGNNGGYTKDIRDLIEAYNGRQSVTKYGSTYDFSEATGKILFVHAGHAHFDEQYTKQGMTIPLLITTCAKNETSMNGLTLVSGNSYEATGAPFNTTGWTCKFWPDRTLGTITEAAFDVVSVGASSVNVFRVGAGEDRMFNLT